MNNLFVYLEIEEHVVQDVSLELLTKGRSLANTLGCRLEAVAVTDDISGIKTQVADYGVDRLHCFADKRFAYYSTMPHAAILCKLFTEEKPQIVLMGATTIGRDLGPRVSSALGSGLTADCTSLEIGNHEDKKQQKVYDQLLYQIRPAFGGNIVATIINPDCRPQMATVRNGVMKKEICREGYPCEQKDYQVSEYVSDSDFLIEILDRRLSSNRLNLGAANIIIAGGYGIGSKENFDRLHEFAHLIGAEVGATRAAVDAGFAEHARQIGQTGVTVRPKLYIAFGISGQIQHLAGMQESAMVISVNSDPEAPINAIADYVITGAIEEVLPKMVTYYKKNSK